MKTIEKAELALEDFFDNIREKELQVIFDELDALENDEGVTLDEYLNPPIEIKICKCNNCRIAKSKRNRISSNKFYKRLHNKKRRNSQYNGKVINFYHA